MKIGTIDAQALKTEAPDALEAMRYAATTTGFAVVENAALSPADVSRVLACYRAFFALPADQKAAVDMAQTGASRGWGAAGAEQVDPASNPDYKQVFDSGYQIDPTDPRSRYAVYAPNLWPENPPGFRSEIESYFATACEVAMDILRGLAQSLGQPKDSFDAAFDAPMALLRGNYYPPRPAWAGDKDFGIAAHTDYGCLTLLATDGVAGLEVQLSDGTWLPVTAPPGTFVINFGEMMEIWTEGRVRATMHRVKGANEERVSAPLFFNPSYDANVAPPGATEPVLAGPYLASRYNETYVHLQEA